MLRKNCYILYKASITSGGTSKHYIGFTETEFKARYYNHFFRNREKRNATELLKAFWNAENSGHEPAFRWSTADRAKAYQPGSLLLQFMPDRETRKFC